MDSKHRIAIHISSVEEHDHTEDMHTLLPFPYNMLWHKYDAHVAPLYFYIYHICKFDFFTRPSVLSILDLIFEFFKYLSHQDSNDECILWSEMQHSHPHITLYCAGICFNCGGNNLLNVYSLIIILLSSSLDYFRLP